MLSTTGDIDRIKTCQIEYILICYENIFERFLSFGPQLSERWILKYNEFIKFKAN